MTHREFRKILGKTRRRYNPLQHEIRKKHKLSRRTVFYMKEYGPGTSVAGKIIRESLKILLLTSIISSTGGVSLESIRSQLVVIPPVLIVLPALNDMIGDFGTIVASRFTTALFAGQIRGRWWHLHFLHRLLSIVSLVAVVSAVYIASLAILVSILSGFPVTFDVMVRLTYITLISTVLLVLLIFNLSVVGGLWIYKKGEDPNNFLIPITTSVADLGSLIVFAYLVTIFF